MKTILLVEDDPFLIDIYAKKLKETTLRDSTTISNRLNDAEYCSTRVKGKFGQYVEQNYFGIKNNSEKTPDFKEISLELKSTPLKKNKGGKLKAKERLVLNIINYEEIVKENWENSTFLSKNEMLLLIFYLYEKNKVFLDFLIKFIEIWKITDHKIDLEIIKQDWKTIVGKIRKGKAHELSEGDTIYLSACRKGAGNGRDFRKQPNSDIRAPQRALSFKPKFMNSIIEKIENSEPLFNNVKQLKKKTFEENIYDKFIPYLNKEIKEIESMIGTKLNSKSNKGYYANLARRMLGVKTKRIDEFEKADISMKIIRLKENGVPKEDMSFPKFNPIDIIKQNWEESKFYDYLNKKFLFIVYQMEDDKVFFEKAFLWNIPYEDLMETKMVWEKTKKIINEGVKVWKDGKINRNNLPKKSENRVSHVRPHGKDSRDTYSLPDGRKITKQCFWLNSKYLKEQIEKN